MRPSHIDVFLRDLNRERPSLPVITDSDALTPFASDASEVTPRAPDAAVLVESTEDVAACLKLATAHGVPITPRSGGTGRVGGAVPIEGGVVLSTSRLNRTLGVEHDDLYAVLEPGVVLGDFHSRVEAEGLFYPPDPNSWDTCQLGGNIAANAGGPRAFKYGVTGDHVLGLTVVTPKGEVIKTGRRTRKGVTGYDLTSLMVGSEGTLGVVTEATLRLVPKPEGLRTLLVFVSDIADVAKTIASATRGRVVPRCLEMLDNLALSIVKPSAGLPVPKEAKGMLLLELDGDEASLDSQMERVGNGAIDAGALEVLVASKGDERERLWAARRNLSYSFRKHMNHKLAEDVVVPTTRLAELLERCREISSQQEVLMPSYGHAGDGNLHVNFLWDDDDARPRVDRAVGRLFEEVVAMGGTLSGEHGIGVLKAPYLSLEQSPALITLQREIKKVFDPAGILNPGKVLTNAPHRAC